MIYILNRILSIMSDSEKTGKSKVIETVYKPYWARFWCINQGSGKWRLGIEICNDIDDYLTDIHYILDIKEDETCSRAMVARIFDAAIDQYCSEMEERDGRQYEDS